MTRAAAQMAAFANAVALGGSTCSRLRCVMLKFARRGRNGRCVLMVQGLQELAEVGASD